MYYLHIYDFIYDLIYNLFLSKDFQSFYIIFDIFSHSTFFVTTEKTNEKVTINFDWDIKLISNFGKHILSKWRLLLILCVLFFCFVFGCLYNLIALFEMHIFFRITVGVFFYLLVLQSTFSADFYWISLR